MQELDTYIEIEEIEDNFSRVPNIALRDNRLSLKSKGLYAYLCSNKSDWKIYRSELLNHFSDGRDSLNAAFKELEVFGYLKNSQIRVSGKFMGSRIKIFIKPAVDFTANGKTVYGETVDGKTVNGKSATNNTIDNKTNGNNIMEGFQPSSDQKVKSSIPKQQKKQKEKKEDAPIFNLCRAFWLDEFHPGWSFNGMTGKSLYEIIKKLKSKLQVSKPDFTDEDVAELFKAICNKLPEWYKAKDLPVINSKFNELFEEIKSGLYGGAKRPAKGESVFRTWKQGA